jgi:hypothetical protein
MREAIGKRQWPRNVELLRRLTVAADARRLMDGLRASVGRLGGGEGRPVTPKPPLRAALSNMGAAECNPPPSIPLPPLLSLNTVDRLLRLSVGPAAYGLPRGSETDCRRPMLDARRSP